MIVICTPVDTIARYVRLAAKSCRSPTLITDAGSTKETIARELAAPLANACRFLGAHPLAGSEKTGVEHARADLFAGRTTVVTPTAGSSPDDVILLSAVWNSLGAKVHAMSPAEHDRAVAATSHAPHVIAAALAAATPDEYLPLAAAGWLDTTRIAALDADIWRPIFASNRANVLNALEAFEKTMAALRRAIDKGDDRLLNKVLAEAREKRDALGN
jgi:cyclohexadieny/prephenate dehydrogenase